MYLVSIYPSHIAFYGVFWKPSPSQIPLVSAPPF